MSDSILVQSHPEYHTGGLSDLRNTIDAEQLRTQRLCETLVSGGHISPRELRRIWESRHRPFWRLSRHLYLNLARRLVGVGENYLAIDVVSEGKSFFSEDPDLLFQEALASARCGSIERAREILATSGAIGRSVEDAAALAARLYKDAWKTTGETQYLQTAFENYLEAYKRGLNPAFTGTNAASMALLLGRRTDAAELAGAVLQAIEEGRMVQGDMYWDTVTRAECQLVLGRICEAGASYTSAAALPGALRANLLTARAQARLLLPCHNCSGRSFDECFGIPIVACFTGHRIDEPERERPRFPASRERAVSEEIAATIRDRRIGIGFSAAANGADLLFIEALQAAQGETFIYLPTRQQEFKRLSVESAGTGWERRFDDVVRNCDALYEVETASEMAASEAFEYGNRICLGSALRKARELDTDFVVLAVWDGSPGERGGTGDFVRLVEERQYDLITIDPLGRSRAVSRAPVTPPVPPGSTWPIRALVALRLSGASAEAPSGGRGEQLELRKLTDAFSASVVDISVHGVFVCVLLKDVLAAVDFAFTLLKPASMAAAGFEGAIGLHAGPMRIERSILTGSNVIEGAHVQMACHLAILEPQGYVYASNEFASLSELGAIQSGVRFEYLGQQTLAGDSVSRTVFRAIRSESTRLERRMTNRRSGKDA